MDVLPKIPIIYEDNHLLVVEKPVNTPVCEDESGDVDLLSLLKEYLKNKYRKPGNVYLGLVHRLDRPVSGVMVFAKTSKAASRLSLQIQNHQFEKIYYAVVENKMKDHDTFIDYLKKDPNKNMTFVTSKDNGKYACLDYRLVGYKDHFSLVEIRLHTGRSHQIRVQFASRGHPLVGDAKYNPHSDHKTNIALFAKSLSFYHPVTKEKMTFDLELPKRYPFHLF